MSVSFFRINCITCCSIVKFFLNFLMLVFTSALVVFAELSTGKFCFQRYVRARESVVFVYNYFVAWNEYVCHFFAFFNAAYPRYTGVAFGLKASKDSQDQVRKKIFVSFLCPCIRFSLFLFCFFGVRVCFFFPFCFNRFELIGTRESMTKDMGLVLPKDTNKSIAIWTKSLLPKDYWRDAEEDIREILISLMDRENCQF